MAVRNAPAQSGAATAALVLLLAVVVWSPAAAQSDAEYRRAFDLVLLDPANPAHNLHYARLAIERGELSRAQAAYERILERDPNNREALDGLRAIKRRLEPTFTEVTLSVGPHWESNPLRLRQSEVTHGDIAVLARGTLRDERPAFGWRWRTEGVGTVLKWGTFNEVDVADVALASGPVVPLGSAGRLYTFAGVGYSAVRWRFFAAGPTAGLSWELDDAGPLKSVTARWNYSFVGNAFSQRDSTQFEIFPRFIVDDLALKGSTAILIPYFRYSGVFGSGSPTDDPRNQPFPARGFQAGTRGDFFVPVLRNVSVGVFAIYEYRHYYEAIPGETKNRRDHYFAPGAQFIIASAFLDQIDLVGSYTYELRVSNDGVQNYSNHLLTLRFVRRF
jgi:hypothetical protein